MTGQTLDDHRAIEHLLYRYADLVDAGDFAGIGRLFARGRIVAGGSVIEGAAAVQAMYETGKALRDGAKPSELKGVASNEVMAKMTRADDYEAAAKAFLSD